MATTISAVLDSTHQALGATASWAAAIIRGTGIDFGFSLGPHFMAAVPNIRKVLVLGQLMKGIDQCDSNMLEPGRVRLESGMTTLMPAVWNT